MEDKLKPSPRNKKKMTQEDKDKKDSRHQTNRNSEKRRVKSRVGEILNLNNTRDFPGAERQAPRNKEHLQWDSTSFGTLDMAKNQRGPDKVTKSSKATWQKVFIEMKKAKIKTQRPEQTQTCNKRK